MVAVSALSGSAEMDIVSFPVETLILFYGFVALIYAASAILWQLFSSTSESAARRTAKEAVLDTGLIAIGKYVPGKIWGIFARGAISRGGISMSKSSIAVSSFEQAYILVLGVFLAASLMLFQGISLLSAWILLPVLMAIICAPTLLRKYKDRWPALTLIPKFSAGKATLLVIGYLILWILTSMPVLTLLASQHDLTIAQVIDVVTAFTGAMLAGWIALFAPGGVGIREAAFATAAPEWLSWQQGLFWIATHRFLYTFFDIVFGGISLFILARDIRGAQTNA